MWTEKDRLYMTRALELAQKGLGLTWPNPLVGAVIVKANKVIGEGWHRKYGGSHAEVVALKKAGVSAKGATVYVTLEPCSHYGKTPPCALALKKAGVKKVIVAMGDPNPLVAGKGFEILRQAGIETVTGLLEEEAKKLNKVFLKKMQTGLPYVISKAAITLDGKIACHNNVSKWITGEKSRSYGHYLRSIAEAILIGSETLKQDNPKLDVRFNVKKNTRNPLPVIVEGKQMITKHYNLIRNSNQQNVIIATTRRVEEHPLKNVKGVELLLLPGKKNRVSIKHLLEKLGERNISLLMIEGGAEIQASFLGLDQNNAVNSVDEIHWMIAPKIVGGKKAKSVVGGTGADSPEEGVHLQNVTYERLGDDLLMKAQVQRG